MFSWLHAHGRRLHSVCSLRFVFSQLIRGSLCSTPPPCTESPPPWTLDVLRFPRDPPTGGGWTLDFSASPTNPLGGGGWTLDFLKSPTDPPGLHTRRRLHAAYASEGISRKRGRGHTTGMNGNIVHFVFFIKLIYCYTTMRFASFWGCGWHPCGALGGRAGS